MVKKLQVKKFVKTFVKKFVKKHVKKNRQKNLSKNASKNRQKKSSKNSLKKFIKNCSKSSSKNSSKSSSNLKESQKKPKKPQGTSRKQSYYISVKLDHFVQANLGSQKLRSSDKRTASLKINTISDLFIEQKLSSILCTFQVPRLQLSLRREFLQCTVNMYFLHF